MKLTTKRMTHGIKIVTLLCLLTSAMTASAKDVNIDGKNLTYLGEGLREFLFIDIYKLGAYSESGACKPTDIIYKDETKMMKLKMIRAIPIDRLKSNLKSTFEDNLPTKGDVEGLKKKIDSFLAMFKKDLSAGTEVDIVYSPGKGTRIRTNGKALGSATPGKDFSELVWRSYFGSKTCCKSLKSDIISACKKK